MGTIVEDVRDLLHLLNSENFTSGIVRRVENKDLARWLGKLCAQYFRIKLPNVTLESEWDSIDFTTSKLGVIKIKWEHWLEGDDLFSFVTVRVDE